MRIDVREYHAGLWGFYPANREKLLREIERSFKDSVKGPGQIPHKANRYGVDIVGGVVPHAGYAYSGPCACWFYKRLAENVPKIDTVIIVGTNHTGFGGRITTTTYYKRWATPLGEVEVDMEFINCLKNLFHGIDDDVLAHLREHSVEVQLPFLQFIYDSFRLVPIVVKDVDLELAKNFAKALHEAITKSGKRCLVLASSDFTHHGSIYGYVIYRNNVSENVRKLDMQFIDRILSLDTKGFLDLIYKYDATVCGYGAIAILMEYARLMQCSVELLKYYHSGDVTGEEDIIVGYASIVFYRSAQ